MTISGALWFTILTFLLLKLAGLLYNLRAFPVLQSSTAARHPERISLLVPARNEADNLPETLPGFLDQPAHEILLLDDNSEDNTLNIACNLAESNPRLRVLSGSPLPNGWIGKNWACHQLAEAATGSVLIFTDADVNWEPGALDALMQEMTRQQAEAFSVFPRQQTETTTQRTLLPLIDNVLLSFLPFILLRLPAPSAAVANGQVFAFRRSTYDSLDGHRSVKSEILEDIRLAQRVRRKKFQLGLALGGELISVRMYRKDSQLVQGLAKSLLAAHGNSRLFMLIAASWHLLAYTLPVLLLPFSAHWALLVLLAFAERGLVNFKTGRQNYTEMLLMPLAPLLALPVYLSALSKQPVWKGRRYS